jgi:hypothetical protein
MRIFFPLVSDSKIVARSRELVAQSRELLRWSEPYVDYPYPLRNEDTGLCVEPESGGPSANGEQPGRPSGTRADRAIAETKALRLENQRIIQEMRCQEY